MDAPRNMRLALPASSSFSDAEIQASLSKRIPCFIGGQPTEDLFHPEVAYTDYTQDEALEAQKFGMRYAIAGLAKVEGLSHPVVIIHTWAPNLESCHSPDFKHLMNSNGNLKVSTYRQCIKDMAECIYKAAAAYAAPNSTINLYIPLVGQGFYVATLSMAGQHHAEAAFLQAINEVAPQYPQVRSQLVGLGASNSYPKDSVVPFVTQDLFSIQDDSIYAVINAWDSHSFIGIGGSQDASLDGWLVAGTGPNKSFRNTSYLHNVFFNPELLDCRTW
eukprot:CAMPEP_0117683230 /NCGR_PEP_ID=MMETSP0804-20121206/20247_1 /TAXON_ID=1074897 /ORGANISM="Tetraselmis astigmatica, Strain CCMP880" /LENGTH=274 /DNA_ID=CAMNT_0005493725 /DNA_START=72 /DNA_END=894 /DNA_ORIENTATION=-